MRRTDPGQILVTDGPCQATGHGGRPVRQAPARFVFLVEWDSVAAHLDNFRATDRFARWRGALGPFFAAPPAVEHFVDVRG